VKVDSKSDHRWAALEQDLSQYTILTILDLQALVTKNVGVQTGYAARKLIQAGTLEKISLGQRSLYVVKRSASRRMPPKDPLQLLQIAYGENLYYCYGTALFLHGISRYGRLSVYYLGSNKAQNQKKFGESMVQIVKTPVGKDVGVKTHRLGDQTVFVTDIERTILDCLHRPKYSEGWENVFHALRRIKEVDDVRILGYVKLYKIPSLTGRVGVVLEHFKDDWGVSESTLARLQQYCTHQPVRFLPNRSGTLNKRWRLYVPNDLFEGDLR
jgi:predicted transcriptional regulator of viral defense system